MVILSPWVGYINYYNGLTEHHAFLTPNKMYHRRTQLRFECTGCGKCCYGKASAYVGLSHTEADRIQRLLGISKAWFQRRYLIKLWDNKIGLRLLANGRCVLLGDNNKCRAYSLRPGQCRTYPFWPEVLENKRAWLTEAKRCEGINRDNFVPQANIEKKLKASIAAENVKD